MEPESTQHQTMSRKIALMLVPVSLFIVANILVYDFDLRTIIGIGILLTLLTWQLLKPEFSQQRVYTPQRINTNYLLSFVSSFLAGILAVLSAKAAEHWQFGLFYHWRINPVILMILSVVLLDLSFFYVHWLFHRVKKFRPFHLIHHSDPAFDISLMGRDHPVTAVSLGIARGLVIFPLGISLENCLIYFFIAGFCTAVAHSNIHIPIAIERAASLFFITPKSHYIHHSRKLQHANSNYGIIFSGWDRLFGTYTDPWQTDLEAIEIGAPNSTATDQSNLKELLTRPFAHPQSATPKVKGAKRF